MKKKIIRRRKTNVKHDDIEDKLNIVRDNIKRINDKLDNIFIIVCTILIFIFIYMYIQGFN